MHHGDEVKPPTAGASPYAAQLDSPVRGLSAQEVDDLLNGRGMGLARAAELSGYPGPRHVLDLADDLELDETVRSSARALFERMQAEARELGAEIVERERELGQSFLDRTVTADQHSARVEEIAAMQAKLRMVHLRAHLELTPRLSAEQISRYAQLRGYTSASTHAKHHAN